MAVDWTGLRVTPWILLWLLLVPALVGIGAMRLYFTGDVLFYPPALMFGWLGALATAWASWLLVPDGRDPALPGPATAMHLCAMLFAQALMPTVAIALVGLVILQGMESSPPELRGELYRTAMWSILAWIAVGHVRLVWRVDGRGNWRRWVASAVLVALLAANNLVDRPPFWYVAQVPVAQEPARSTLEMTQEMSEQQPQLLRDKLGALKAGAAAGTNLYAITFAPYAAEDVFRRESELVAGVMQHRFGAAGRPLQLVNSADTATTWPWATPLNLHRAIGRMAQLMDRERDILFIHLTSHGARDGQLSADFGFPGSGLVTPGALRDMLDAAGIRHRVISVSACYSGSWIEPLAGPDTLVMTAADADHTSYGCGRGSELTYFRRAMFAEALQTTWSFEQAHATARGVIDQREKAAGKSDGFSNPQIRMGDAIRVKLAQWAAQRQAQH